MDNPCLARADISAEVNNKEHAVAVDLSNTGEANVRSTSGQPCQSKNKTVFIKDKCSLITTDIDTKLELSLKESDNLTHNYYEYEQGPANIIAKDRLKNHYSFWESIGCYDYILGTILNGYTIPFHCIPPSVCLQNNRSAILHGEFVTEAIDDLLLRGLIEECENQPYVVNPLTVSTSNSRKKRLILDLRHVNKHLWKTSIKFEDIRIAMEFITKKYFCCQFDVVSVYHHVNIFLPHRFSRILLEVRKH
jgi:hypothetical protein